MKAKELINCLAKDLKPVKVYKPLRLTIVLWLIISFIIVGISAYFLGIRDDIHSRFNSILFLSESLLIFGLSISASYAAFKTCVPGSKCKKNYYFLIPLTGWILLILFKAVTGIPDQATDALDYSRGIMCISTMAKISAIPLILMILTIVPAISIRPKFTGAMVAISCGALGALGLQFTCNISDSLHIFLWHFLPLIAIGGIGIFLGHKILRW